MEEYVEVKIKDNLREGYPSLEWCNIRKSAVDGMINALLKEQKELGDKIQQLMHESRTLRMQIKLHNKEFTEDD